MTSGETWAVWRSDDGRICVFSTESGDLVYNNDHSGPSAILISSVSERFWNVGYRDRSMKFSSLYVYNRETKTFDQSMTEYKHTPSVMTSGIGLDNDRGLLFRLLHSCSPTGQNPRTDWPSDTLDPLIGIGVSRLTTVHKTFGDRQGEMRVEAIHMPSVTLPGNSKARNRRRDLEVELPWTIREGDFFGIVNNYLVYHAMRDELLVVVDFWPDW